ncbi:Protein SYM1 [Bienertia sinuspersici]
MAIAFIRKRSLDSFRHYLTPSPNYCHSIKHHHHHIYNNTFHHQQQQQQQYVKRHYSRFSKKSGKEFEVPAPPFIVGSSVPSSNKLSVISRIRFIRWYLEMINSRPILTKSVSSSLIYMVADITSQTIAPPSSEPYDIIRTLRMTGYGGMILGPTLHYWFNFLSKILPGRDLLTTVKKMTLGQTVFGPIMTAIFFSMNAAFQGENSGEIFARLKRDLLPTMLNGIMYWPICDFITFKFVPVQLQPLVSNSFSYVWTVYMTYMASLEKPSVA